ncbi:MAG: hypothetical protein GX351_10745 [Peptococcaceae bacterium]|jgi:hypothetical protein|nr:hypothetical protein [Peptococcaceae bacterium]
MEGQEYVYRMKVIIAPGLGFLILYPLLLGIVSYFFKFPELYMRIFTAIYLSTALIILGLWIVAKSRKVIIQEDAIVFRSLFGKKILKPVNIRKVSFFWTKKDEEIVQLRVGKKAYYLTNLYFPFNELLTDLEEFILKNNIRSNLSSHYGLN